MVANAGSRSVGRPAAPAGRTRTTHVAHPARGDRTRTPASGSTSTRDGTATSTASSDAASGTSVGTVCRGCFGSQLANPTAATRASDRATAKTLFTCGSAMLTPCAAAGGLPAG